MAALVGVLYLVSLPSFIEVVIADGPSSPTVEIHEGSLVITPKPLWYEPVPATVIGEMIAVAANEYGVSFGQLYGTLDCESDTSWKGGRKLDPEAVGDGGDSLGLCQINMPAHPEISGAQALNPAWCVVYAAQQFKKGNASQWSCYIKHFK